MEENTILNEFEKWQAEFYDTVHAFYRNGNKPRGDLAFSTWQRRFLEYLETNFPNKKEEYNQFVHPRYVATVTNIFNTPLENFMSTKGDKVVAFLEECMEETKKDYLIKNNTTTKTKQQTLIKNSNHYSKLLLSRCLLIFPEQQVDLS